MDIHDNGVRLPADRWGDFWSVFIHVVNNAIDHGIEEPQVRTAQGKPPQGHIFLSSQKVGDHFVIELTDDGKGIDWKGLSMKARSVGLPRATRDHLVRALFSDGITTLEKASETSGRGVGMGAVEAACARLGGRIGVISTTLKGTTLRFVIPCRGNEACLDTSMVAGARPSIAPPPDSPSLESKAS